MSKNFELLHTISNEKELFETLEGWEDLPKTAAEGAGPSPQADAKERGSTPKHYRSRGVAEHRGTASRQRRKDSSRSAAIREGIAPRVTGGPLDRREQIEWQGPRERGSGTRPLQKCKTRIDCV